MTLTLALILDAVIGDPDRLWKRVPHPAAIMGRLIGWGDRLLNRGGARRAKGVALMGVLVLLALALGLGLRAIPGPFAEIILGAILLAQKSLSDHVRRVADALDQSLPAARSAVAMIVGRDTSALDESGIARAAIESASENFSDGVVAPALWFAVAGLPGLLIYKITNTADSMIGYKTPRHKEFGWAAARFDDLLNWVPARISAGLIALSAFRVDAFAFILRDAPLHRSPNAGWPEAAMAVVLNVSLSGPRSYAGEKRDFPFVYDEGRKAIGAAAIRYAVRAMWRAWVLLLVLAALLWLA